MSFTPNDYTPPKTKSNYFSVSKLKEKTDNIIRILTNPVMGWLDWSEDSAGKKVPIRTNFNEQEPEPIDTTKPVKHFWAMVVYDYADKAIKIMEVTQSTIQEAIYSLDNDDAWGDPTKYDLNIKRTGEKLETKYFVTPRPPKPLSKEVTEAMAEGCPDLRKLFTNEDPFAHKVNFQETAKVKESEEDEDEEIRVENIPF